MDRRVGARCAAVGHGLALSGSRSVWSRYCAIHALGATGNRCRPFSRMEKMPVAISLNLPNDRSAPTVARRTATRQFDGLLQPQRLDDLQLVLSELVSNAVIHGRGEVVLRLDFDGSTVRGEVIDQGRGFERELRVSGPGDVGGRGLMLVEQLANRWGVHEGTTHVWFEMSAKASAAVREPHPELGEAARPSELDRPDDQVAGRSLD
jgi:anti-sigma regulatory factor (Ser/Thr protein kinase)